MIQISCAAGGGAVSLQNGARAHQSRRRVVAALHLRVKAQRLLEVRVPLRDQPEIIKGIVDELARGQELGEIAGAAASSSPL